MRVLAIAQRLDQAPAERAIRRRRIGELVREPVGDGGVIGGGAGIGLGGELAAQRQRGRAVVLRRAPRSTRRIVAGIDHDRHVGVVLGGGADHGGAADVDVLDAGLEVGALRDRRLERIEVDDQEIDRPDAVCAHRRGVVLVVADREQAAMHLGMQRLHAAVHHLGKAGELGDVEHGEAGIGQRLAGAAGRDELDAVLGERAGEIDQAGLVGDGDEGAGDAAESRS